jgi:hypothetical protein
MRFPGQGTGRLVILRFDQGVHVIPAAAVDDKCLTDYFTALDASPRDTTACNTSRPFTGGPDNLSGCSAMARRTIGKTWTIGQKTSTHGQDRNRLREAKFITGRDVKEQRHP